MRVAERTAEGALLPVRGQRSPTSCEQVIDAYFAVMGARANLQVLREAEALAQRTVDENKARVKVGLLPPVAILEAQADASRAARRRDPGREPARGVAAAAGAALLLPPRRHLRAAHARAGRVRGHRGGARRPRRDARRRAGGSGPEIHASAKGVQARQLNERIASNALLPRLDVVGGYGVNGLAGKDRADANRPASSSSSARRTSATASSSAPAPTCAITVTTGTPPSPFAGTKGDAFDRMAPAASRPTTSACSSRCRSTTPPPRRSHTRSRIELNQSELNHRELLSQVTLEVRQSVADVLSSRQRIDASRVARELAEENLRSQQKRYEVGMATTKDLLDFQQRLTSARAAEVQANFDYAGRVAAWRRAQGTLLEQYHIVLEHPKLKPAPWFAKF